MKSVIRSFANSFGYDIRRLATGPQPAPVTAAVALAEAVAALGTGPSASDVLELKNRLAYSEALRSIRRQDAVEIEELLRMVALPDLPPRKGREMQLTNLIGTTVSEGLYVADALQKALKVEGDICEFGVAQGATSQLIAMEIIDTVRDFYLFDSFEGLPPPTDKDVLIDDIFNLGSMEAYRGTMKCAESEVRGRLAEVSFPEARTKIMKGWVNETLARSDAPKQIAFAYIDFDFYEPIRDALVYVDACMPAGGYVVVDDYGYFSEGAQLATDEFVAARSSRWKLSKPIECAGHFVTLAKTG